MFSQLRCFGAVVVIAVASFLTPTTARSQTAQLPIDRAEANIVRTHKQYRAWLRLDLATAHAQAAAISASAVDSPLRRLNGLVVAVKDNIDTSWLPTTAGARALRNRQPPQNATVVDRILAAGGVIPGKTNMDTFGRGVRTISEIGGQTRNAIDSDDAPGGSSGGTAVAIALGQADVGIGTDTCGSLRYPAAYNGIYGLRPTPGLVSRAGIIPLSPTHDVVGPMARNPLDLAMLLDVIAGHDPRDPLTDSSPELSYAHIAVPPDARLRVGVLHDRGVYRTAGSGRSSLTLLTSAGVELVEIELPLLSLPNVINEEFAVLKPRILNGSLVDTEWLGGVLGITTRTYQLKLHQMRTDRTNLIAFLDAKNLDAVVYPTTPYKAVPLGSPQPSANCSLSSSTGLPAITLPHPDAPIPGIDVIGRPFAETLLLQVAMLYDAELLKR